MQETTIKSHLRKFSGFAKPLSDKERKALASKLEALTLSELRDLADVLDTDRKSNKVCACVLYVCVCVCVSVCVDGQCTSGVYVQEMIANHLRAICCGVDVALSPARVCREHHRVSAQAQGIRQCLSHEGHCSSPLYHLSCFFSKWACLPSEWFANVGLFPESSISLAAFHMYLCVLL